MVPVIFFAKFDDLVMVTLSLCHHANLEWQNLLTKFSWNSKRTEKSGGKMVPNILEQIISDLHLLCKFISAVHSLDVMDFNLLQYFVSTNESYWVAIFLFSWAIFFYNNCIGERSYFLTSFYICLPTFHAWKVCIISKMFFHNFLFGLRVLNISGICLMFAWFSSQLF